MLEEGLYGLDYKAEGEDNAGKALAILRNGKILGSDPWGAVFMGFCEYDAASARNNVRLRIAVPPEGALVTGFSAGPEGATLDIVGTFERAAPRAVAVVEVGGRPVEVQLTYLGPLPN